MPVHAVETRAAKKVYSQLGLFSLDNAGDSVQVCPPHADDARASNLRTPQGQVNNFDQITIFYYAHWLWLNVRKIKRRLTFLNVGRRIWWTCQDAMEVEQ